MSRRKPRPEDFLPAITAERVAEIAAKCHKIMEHKKGCPPASFNVTARIGHLDARELLALCEAWGEPRVEYRTIVVDASVRGEQLELLGATP